MIKMTYSQLSSDGFMMAMRKLINTAMPLKQSYQVKKIADEINRAKKKIHDEYQKEIVETYARRNEDGTIATTSVDGTPVPFEVVQEKLSDYAEATSKFSERTVTIDRFPLTVDAFSDVKLSASDLSFIEPLFGEGQVLELASVTSPVSNDTVEKASG